MIRVNDRDGNGRDVDAVPGKVLMLQLRPLKIGIVGLCGGNAVCGTCHVLVRPDWLDRLPEPDEFEQERLDDLDGVRPNSRLACQIQYGPELDGLEITVATRR